MLFAISAFGQSTTATRTDTQQKEVDAAQGAQLSKTEIGRVWLSGELMHVFKASYGSSITPYTGGMTGWVPVAQTIVS